MLTSKNKKGEVASDMLKDKGYYKGMNLGGWLSQCDYSESRLDHYIEEKDFEKIASWGFDHVRLPIDYNVLESQDGASYKESGFSRIARALDLAKKYHLHVVLDLHKTAGFSFDKGEEEKGFFENEKYQERFCRLWEEMAKRFGKYSDMVAFELLNEITEKSYITVWNRLSQECIQRIRAYAPDTLIFIGSYDFNSPKAVPDLAAPYDDKIVYNFHCYEPLIYTHQGATWTEAVVPEERYRFEDCGITPEFFEELISPAIEKAKKHGADLYCGEYGMIDTVDPAEGLKWFKVIHGIFEKYGISRAVWTYKEMDFGISDSRMDGIREELLHYL